jgi:hypothetical protein
MQTVFLVGGFAASDYLYAKLKEGLIPRGLVVSRPESHAYVISPIPSIPSISF